jgi:REP element-mobilizing transposase RayT
MEVLSHVVFALKSSRYDYEKVRRKKSVGFVAPTYPFIEGKEEEILVEEICNIAKALNLTVLALNFCGDHVHCLINHDESDLASLMGLWKGKVAYNFNRRINQSINNQIPIKSDGTKQALWAKSYFQKILFSEPEIQNTITYIINNRKKHGLNPLSDISLKHIELLLLNNEH